MSTRRPARRVPPDTLRRIFNDGGYVDRLAANELLETVDTERPARSEAGQVPGTMSRMVWYYEVGSDGMLSKVALVHEYRRPDGSIGGSGLPDPKRLLLEGEILFC